MRIRLKTEAETALTTQSTHKLYTDPTASRTGVVATFSHCDVITVSWRRIEIVICGDRRLITVVNVDLEAQTCLGVIETVIRHSVQPDLNTLGALSYHKK